MTNVVAIEAQRIRRKLSRLFGEDQAKVWLNTPNVALGGEVPAHLLNTPEGLRLVRDVVGRIEHGVYS